MQTSSVFGVEGFTCGEIIIWAKTIKPIGDGDALKQSLDLKGASGHFKCPRCSNVVSMAVAKKTNLAVTDMVCISELDVKKFQAHTDESFIANAKHLEAQKPLLSNAEFRALESSLGINYAPGGVLLCSNIEFKITESGFDYHHVYFVHGIFNMEVGFLLDKLKREPVSRRVKHSDIHKWFQPFTWPFLQRHGKVVFEYRSKEGGPLSCSASEGIGCFLLLQIFLNLTVFETASDHVKSACCSYYALCTVLVMLTMSARGNVTPEQLMGAILTHFRLHKIAYGESQWKPKQHWAMHLPDQLRSWKCLVACFTHERKHKEVKRYMQTRCNPHLAFDKNVLQDVLHVQTLVLEEDLPYPAGICLIGQKAAKTQIERWVQAQLQCASPVMTAVLAKASDFTAVHVHDVVCIDWDDASVLVGQVFLLFSVGGSAFAGVQAWPRTPQVNMYSMTGPAYIVRLQDIIDVCIYNASDGVALVVPPRGTSV